MNFCAGSLTSKTSAFQAGDGGANPTPALQVLSVTREQCKPWILERHYAKRWPSISFAFGLFRGDCLLGVCTYGKPSSAPLRSGIAGVKYSEYVWELNRLCCDNTKNNASFLIAHSLNQLPKPAIVVSYADTNQGHLGIVYQATNFIYTGLSAKRTDWKIRGMDNLHGQTIADMVRGVPGRRVDAIRAKFGDRFYLKDRPRKHRYIYLLGNKTFKAGVRASLLYTSQPYPK